MKEFFSAFGGVAKARVVIDHYTRQSKGFGFVVMAEKEGGGHGLAMMNGAILTTWLRQS